MTTWLERRRTKRRMRDDIRVLGALYLLGEMSGWPLLDNTGLLNTGRLYAALDRLEDAGMIRRRTEPGPEGHPARYLYALTNDPLGRGDQP